MKTSVIKLLAVIIVGACFVDNVVAQGSRGATGSAGSSRGGQSRVGGSGSSRGQQRVGGGGATSRGQQRVSSGNNDEASRRGQPRIKGEAHYIPKEQDFRHKYNKPEEDQFVADENEAMPKGVTRVGPGGLPENQPGAKKTKGTPSGQLVKKEFKMPPRLPADKVAQLQTVNLISKVDGDSVILKWTPANYSPCDGVVVVISTDHNHPMPPQDGYIEWYEGIGKTAGILPLAKVALGKKVYLRVCFVDVDDPPKIWAVSNVVMLGPYTVEQAQAAKRKAMLETCPGCFKPKYACQCKKPEPPKQPEKCETCGKAEDKCTCKESKKRCPICKKTMDECSCKVAGRSLCKQCGKVQSQCECKKQLKAKCAICGNAKDECICKPAKPEKSR